MIMNRDKKHQVIDNFLPEHNLKAIQDLMLGEDFPWFYTPNVNISDKNISSHLFYFTHLFYYNNVPTSHLYEKININLLSFMDIKSLIRVKGNLYPNRGIKELNGFHKDLFYSHKGAIFYLNTNNGKTLLGDNIKIDSVENRLLLFDPSIEHDSENCTDQKIRSNININYF
jgi:hypothetical protein